MDRVEKLNECREEPSVYFRLYITTRAKSGGEPIFVVEGKDDPAYYNSFFSSVLDGYAKVMAIDGKEKVLQLRKDVRSHGKYKKDLVAFFVDKDYDDITTANDIYVTPTYSIENLYCTPDAFRRILDAKCGLGVSYIKSIPAVDIKEAILEEYARLFALFTKSNKLKFTNYLYYYTSKYLSSEQLPYNKIVKLNVDSMHNYRVKLGGKFAQLKKFKKDYYSKYRLCFGWKNILRNPYAYYRGKQQLEFLKVAVRELQFGGYFYDFVKSKFGVEVYMKDTNFHEHLLSNAAGFATKPKSLQVFLRDFLM